MLSDHDSDLQLRCRRLGHEVNFGYCRQETHGKPCRLILDCWWEQFDVHSFLRAQLSAEDLAQVERGSVVPPPAKLLSLVEMIQQAKDRLKSNP